MEPKKIYVHETGTIRFIWCRPSVESYYLDKGPTKYDYFKNSYRQVEYSIKAFILYV